MTEKMQTVCVGRMLIDLPKEADFALYGTWIDGFNIESTRESAEVFAARLKTREAEIRATPDRLGGNRNMESARDLQTRSGLAGKLFVHTRDVSEGTAAKGLELEHYRYESVALEGHVHAQGISVSLTANEYDPEKIANLAKLIDKLVVNPANGVVTEPGFCIDNAYFRDPLIANQGERIRLTAGLPSHRDIEIHFDTTAGTKPNAQGLIERNTENSKDDPPEYAMRFTRLRAAPRTIGNLTGDELLLRVVEKNFAVIYGFRWEVLGTENDVFVPDMGLKMVTGRSKEGPIPSSLSQAGVLDLWDKIASSVRVRQTQVQKVSVAAPPSAPLGTFASAGDSCPQSGWWKCGDGGHGIGVMGGERQYLRQGERMPQALLLPPQTLWQKVRGLQQSYEAESPTFWKLVDRRSQRRVRADIPLDQATTVITATTVPVSADTVARSSVGAYAVTGTQCPASGWWQCQESGSLDGARWFAQGSRLPSATFALPKHAHGKTPKTLRTTHRRAIWQLVRLSDAPGAVGDVSQQ